MHVEEPVPVAERAPSAGRDFVGEIHQLLAVLREDPEDPDATEALLDSATEWMRADRRDAPSNAETDQRARLAAWVSHLARDGSVLHFGCRVPEVATALGELAAHVFSLLDHPGRAITAAVRHTSAKLRFGTLDDLADRVDDLANLVVIETDPAGDPVIALDRAAGYLKAGGWIAVIGRPIVADAPGMIEACTFCLDEDAMVRPSRFEPREHQISLIRLAAPIR